MSDLDWLIQHRFRLVARREHDWSFELDDQTWLVAGCLWRLLEHGRIRFTSSDDGHRFGLPAPVDVCAEVNSRLAGAAVGGIRLREGTLDLAITFSTGHVLELIPDSSGYEAWSLGHSLGRSSQRYIAAGGGSFLILSDPLEPG